MTTHDQHPDAETIDAYVVSGLTDAEKTSVDVHAADCAACRDLLTAATDADRSIAARLRPAGVGEDFDDRLVAAVRAGSTPRWRIHPAVRRAAVAAAVVLAVGGLGYGYSIGWRLKTEQFTAKTHTDNTRVDVDGDGIVDAPTVDRVSKMAWGMKNPEATDSVQADLDKQKSSTETEKSVSPTLPAITSYGDSFADRKLAFGWGAAVTKDSSASFDGAASVSNGTLSISPNVSSGFVPQDASVRSKSDMKYGYESRRPAAPPAATDTKALASEAKIALDDHEVTKSLEDAASSHFYRISGGEVAIGGRDRAGAARSKGDGDQLSATDSLGDSDKVRQLGMNIASDSNAANLSYKTKTAGPVAMVSDLPATAGETLTEAPPTTQTVVDTRKIIRTGTMEFEVERFDSALSTLTKVVLEAGGYVGTTESQKLPNGKTRGTVTLRVTPERLDGLVANLRALGDLKTQQISAQDVTKEYTDLQSELTADRAMQDRLLELIKSGKGTIKDLLAAETELGVWRTKIEKAEGAIRYYNSQVALSTLTVTLSEKNIQTPAAAYETETADMGVETDDVEKARNDALKVVADANGRVIEAGLKRLDAGQLAARVVAEIPADGAGSAIDRLKQLGRVARLDVQRQTTSPDAANAPVRTERRPTRVIVSIYNLANVAARRVTTINLAADDVESAYKAAIAAAKDGGGRVVASNLDKNDAVHATGTVTLEVTPAKFEAALGTLRSQGEILKLATVENPDTANTTDAKQAITLQIVSMAVVPARESVQQSLAAVDVRSAYQSVLSAATTAKARIVSAQLNEQDRHNVTAEVQLEVQRSQLSAFDAATAAAAETVSRTSDRSNDAGGTTDAKVAIRLTLRSADTLPARETTRVRVEVSDVDKAATDAQALAAVAHGRVVDAAVSRDRDKGRSEVTMDVPLASGAEVVRQLRSFGTVRGIDASRDVQAPAGNLAHAIVQVDFVTADAIVADTAGPWASVKEGLSKSVAGLLFTLQCIVVGLCLVLPWAIIVWVARKIWRRRQVRAGSTTASLDRA